MALVVDRCYSEDVVNADVYANSCQDIVMSSLKGISGTIFMYGQTGAGKTYTMLGDYSSEVTQHRSAGGVNLRNKTPNHRNSVNN